MEHSYSVAELDDCIAQLVDTAEVTDFFYAQEPGSMSMANLYDAIRDRLAGMGINVVADTALADVGPPPAGFKATQG